MIAIWTAVKVLLEHGVAVHAANYLGQTALHLAAYQGQTAVVQLLHEHYGVPLAISAPKGHQPLHLAAMKGHEATIAYLLSQGAEVAHKDRQGHDVLEVAEYCGQSALVEKLIAHVPSKEREQAPHKAPYELHNTFFAKGVTGLKHPLKKLATTLETVHKGVQTLEALLPAAWQATRLRDEENLQLLYAYFNLAFKQPPLAFENTIERPSRLATGGHAPRRVVSLQSQAAQPHYFARNSQGVTAPFMEPLEGMALEELGHCFFRWLTVPQALGWC